MQEDKQPVLLGPSDRSDATQNKYQNDIDKELLVGLMNEQALVDYEHWKLIINRYPYDARWCTSMLLVLKRECAWEKMTDEEVLELNRLTTIYLQIFDKAERNGSTLSSVQNCPHIHHLQGRK